MKLCRRSAAAAVAALSLAACTWFQTPPLREADRFLNLLQHNRHAAALAECSAETQRDILRRYDTAWPQKLLPEFQSKNLVSYSIGAIDRGEDTAVAHVKIFTKDGAAHLHDIEMVQESGRWRILRF